MDRPEWLKSLKVGDTVWMIYENGARVVNLVVVGRSDEIIRIGTAGYAHEAYPVFADSGRGDGFRIVSPPPTQPESISDGE